jgi:hypothetical protein
MCVQHAGVHPCLPPLQTRPGPATGATTWSLELYAEPHVQLGSPGQSPLRAVTASGQVSKAIALNAQQVELLSGAQPCRTDLSTLGKCVCSIAACQLLACSLSASPYIKGLQHQGPLWKAQVKKTQEYTQILAFVV